MSKFVCTTAADATCGDGQTGSSKVTIEGNGVTRVMADTAVGLIIGPGSQSVFVEGAEVSLPGDAVSTHPPCGSPGQSIHCAATTKAAQSRVSASTGFAAQSGDPGDAPSPDLVMMSFDASLDQIHCSSVGHYPPSKSEMQAAMDYCYDGTGIPPAAPPPPPTVTYSYTVKNSGIDTAQPFVVGFWRFLTTAPEEAIITADSLFYYPDAELVAEQSVGSLSPGQSYSNTFQYPDLYYPSQQFPMINTYTFAVYPDIYNTTTEPDENNSIATITHLVDNFC